MFDLSGTSGLLAGLAAGGLAGTVAVFLLRRRAGRVYQPLLQAADEALAGARADLERARVERDAVLTALSRMGDGVIVTDRDGVVLVMNGAQLDRLRLPEPAVVGRPLIEAVQDHEVNAVVRRCLLEGRPVSAVVETAPGRTYLNITAVPLSSGGGCAVVLEDLSELRRLEKVRREFVANISHELRTPLASLKLLAETLSMGGAGDAELLRDYFGRIDVEVDRLAQMVDELGELSLLESGQIVLERGPVDIAALADGVVERLAAQAARSGLTLVARVTEDVPQPPGDARRLEQALVNLVHNAIKFTPAGGSVSISARGDGDAVSVSVADTGIGIAAEDVERVFERFYKADRSRSSPGTGLGLAIVRHIVQLHGGRVWVESRPGAGATFTFTLPLKKGAV